MVWIVGKYNQKMNTYDIVDKCANKKHVADSYDCIFYPLKLGQDIIKDGQIVSWPASNVNDLTVNPG